MELEQGMSDDIAARIRAVLAEHLGIDLGKVTDDALLVDDLGADSLDIFELELVFEDEFEIHLNFPKAEISQVSDVIDLIRQGQGMPR